VLKIWGRISSINVRKVVLAAQWLGVPFERIDAGHEFGIVKTPDYVAMNPNSLVPTIEDDGLRLWESNVIVRYLCAKHSMGGLYPATLDRRFDAERWMDWQQTTLNPAGRNAFVQLLRTAPEKRQPQLIEQSIAATNPLLQMLDAHLARQPYMAADAFTMADIPIACEIHRWRGTPVPQLDLPHVDRWYAGIRARDAARGVLDLSLS
jgi:glutathione S-transferase